MKIRAVLERQATRLSCSPALFVVLAAVVVAILVRKYWDAVVTTAIVTGLSVLGLAIAVGTVALTVALWRTRMARQPVATPVPVTDAGVRAIAREAELLADSAVTLRALPSGEVVSATN